MLTCSFFPTMQWGRNYKLAHIRVCSYHHLSTASRDMGNKQLWGGNFGIFWGRWLKKQRGGPPRSSNSRRNTDIVVSMSALGNTSSSDQFKAWKILFTTTSVYISAWRSSRCDQMNHIIYQQLAVIAVRALAQCLQQTLRQHFKLLK